MTEMNDEYLFDSEVENEAESGELIYSIAAVPGTVPGQSGLVFAANSTGLRCSADGGQSWEDALAGLNLSETLPVISLAISPQFEQQGNTNDMLFNVYEMVAYFSTHMTLFPGDLLATGTPPGVGMARQPPVFLKPGDVVEIEISGLGRLRNRVVQGG